MPVKERRVFAELIIRNLSGLIYGIASRKALLPSYKDTGKAPTPTKPPLYQQSSQDLSRKDSRKSTDVGEAASAFASPSKTL
jgi:hypothetical protein